MDVKKKQNGYAVAPNGYAVAIYGTPDRRAIPVERVLTELPSPISSISTSASAVPPHGALPLATEELLVARRNGKELRAIATTPATSIF